MVQLGQADYYGSVADNVATEISIEDFKQESLAFLEANAELKAEVGDFIWGEGPDDASLFEDVDREAERKELAKAQEWRAKKFDAGFGWISGAPELGGRGLSRSFERAYAELESRFDVPNQGFFGIGLGMVAPTLSLIHI